MVPRHQIVLLLLFRVGRSLAAGMIILAFPYLVLRQAGALELGVIYAAAALATAAAGLAVGFLADLWGRRRSLWLAGLTLPLSSALILVSHSTPMIFAAALLGGYSATGSLMGGGVGGAAQPIQSTLIASLTRENRRTHWFSWFSFFSGVLSAVGALMDRWLSLQHAFLAATIVSAVGMLPLIWMHVPESRGRIAAMPSLKTIGQFSLTGLINGFSQGLITPFLIPFFVLIFRLPKRSMAVWGLVAGLVAAVALLAAPWLERRFGFVRSIVFTRGLGAALVLLLPFVHILWVALAIYVLTPGLRVAALPAQQTALTARVGAEETGRALGLNQVTRLAASAGAVGLTGYLFEDADFHLPFELYFVITVFNLALYRRFFGWERGRGEAVAL